MARSKEYFEQAIALDPDFAEAHADFRVRPEPADILAALDRLN